MQEVFEAPGGVVPDGAKVVEPQNGVVDQAGHAAVQNQEFVDLKGQVISKDRPMVVAVDDVGWHGQSHEGHGHGLDNVRDGGAREAPFPIPQD